MALAAIVEGLPLLHVRAALPGFSSPGQHGRDAPANR